MTVQDARLDLLLATADERRPVLEGGLPASALEKVRRPRRAPRSDDSPRRDSRAEDPNLLPQQRWGVIAPEGREGDEMLDAMTPLLELRREEQRAPIKVYRAGSDMDAAQAVSWKNREYHDEGVPEAERPRYLLLLGEVDDVSLDLQQALSNGAFVGRLCFTKPNRAPDLDRYAAYANKVSRFARSPLPAQRAAALFYVADDGTAATSAGRSQLVDPCLRMANEGRERGTFKVARTRSIGAEGATVNGFLESLRGHPATEGPASVAPPSVLLSVTHGLGAPEKGWKSNDMQRRRQGALSLGAEILEAESVANVPFLPGGMWFCLACFGAGTPVKSAFHTWLSMLAGGQGYEETLSCVLKSLPGTGFTAALPQAALANPDGPLAVIGHMDLAWTHAFADLEDPSRNRASRIFTTLQLLAGGKRAGVALDILMDAYRWANHDLMAGYMMEADASAAGEESPVRPEERANLWMLRNDLRAYVLLGDPATRLPLAGATFEGSTAVGMAGGKGEPPPTTLSVPAAPATSAALKEAAVIALLRGEEAPRAIAAQAGAALDELYAWFDAYRMGGRKSLGS